MYRRLSRKEKLHLIKKIQFGEKISKVCREAGISRTILYRWIKSYRKADSGQVLRQAQDIARMRAKHWKKLPAKVENKIIKIALKNPSFSPSVISKLTYVSQHGVWSVLKRNGLNLF